MCHQEKRPLSWTRFRGPSVQIWMWFACARKAIVEWKKNWSQLPKLSVWWPVSMELRKLQWLIMTWHLWPRLGLQSLNPLNYVLPMFYSLNLKKWSNHILGPDRWWGQTTRQRCCNSATTSPCGLRPMPSSRAPCLLRITWTAGIPSLEVALETTRTCRIPTKLELSGRSRSAMPFRQWWPLLSPNFGWSVLQKSGPALQWNCSRHFWDLLWDSITIVPCDGPTLPNTDFKCNCQRLPCNCQRLPCFLLKKWTSEMAPGRDCV